MNILGNFIRDRRERVLHMSQAELAAACGLSPGYIHQIETGINPSTGRGFSPKLETLTKLAKGLGVPEDVIVRASKGLSADEPDTVTARTEHLMAIWAALPDDRQEIALRMIQALQDS